MKQIKLINQNLFALVDDEDFDYLNRYNWYLVKSPHNCYAYTKLEGITVYMHQLVLPSESSKLSPDHKNRNGLDNQRHNLRLATPTQQSANRKKQSNGGKYKGVYFRTDFQKWTATIKVNGRQIYLGSYKTETGAAKAYNRAAKEYFGEFAVLNIIEEIKVQ